MRWQVRDGHKVINNYWQLLSCGTSIFISSVYARFVGAVRTNHLFYAHYFDTVRTGPQPWFSFVVFEGGFMRTRDWHAVDHGL